jgi:hypothetical protein
MSQIPGFPGFPGKDDAPLWHEIVSDSGHA